MIEIYPRKAHQRPSKLLHRLTVLAMTWTMALALAACAHGKHTIVTSSESEKNSLMGRGYHVATYSAGNGGGLTYTMINDSYPPDESGR